MFNQPRTIQEASRQARILERASTLFDGNQYHAYDCGNGVWGVARRSFSNEPDTAYTVDLNAQTCTCPDFVKHLDNCKHLMGLQMVIDEEENWERRCVAQDTMMADCELETTGVDQYSRY